MIYRPFIALPDREAAQTAIGEIEALMAGGHWAEAEQRSMAMVQLCLEGLRYMHTYAPQPQSQS